MSRFTFVGDDKRLPIPDIGFGVLASEPDRLAFPFSDPETGAIG
jgi:hypothetical protein